MERRLTTLAEPNGSSRIDNGSYCSHPSATSRSNGIYFTEWQMPDVDTGRPSAIVTQSQASQPEEFLG